MIAPDGSRDYLGVQTAVRPERFAKRGLDKRTDVPYTTNRCSSAPRQEDEERKGCPAGLNVVEAGMGTGDFS
jgi:hypothetical protein